MGRAAKSGQPAKTMNICETCDNWKPRHQILDQLGRATDKGGNSKESGFCLANGPFPSQSAAGPWRAWPVTLASEGCPKWAKLAHPRKKEPAKEEKSDGVKPKVVSATEPHDLKRP